jgi:hypothetical protein
MLEITRAKSNLFENACWKFHKECNQAKTYKFIKISSTYKFLYMSPLPLTVSRLYLTFLTEDYPGNPLHYLRAKSVSFATSAVALLPLPLLYGVIIIMISYWTTFYHDIDFVWFIHTRCIF